MDENKKKNWIKNAAIIFLAIMLVLTLFSNTITQYTLPQVSAGVVKQGKITEKVKGSGTIESGNPYTPKASETRNIDSIPVSKGQHVEMGDVIYNLSDVDSDELKKAEGELADLEKEYMTTLFGAGVTTDTITKARTGNYDSIAAMQYEIADVDKRIEEAQIRYNDCINQVHVQTIIASIDNAYLNNLSDVQREAYLTAEVSKLQLAYPDESPEARDQRTKILNDVKKELADATAARTVSTASMAVEEKKNNLPKTNAETLRDNAKANLDDLNKERENLLAELKAEILVENYDERIQKKQAEIEVLKGRAIGATVTAPMAGTITMLVNTKIEKDKDMYTIIPDGEGFLLKTKIPVKDASKVKEGDSADISNSYNFPNCTVTLKSITDDTENPNQNKVLTFTVDGPEVAIGQNMSVSVGSLSKQCNTIVPKGAIKKDNKGNFVYKIITKSSPLGNRYYAQRIDVKIDSEDDNNAAVTATSGTLDANDYVVLTSSKIVESGKQVRLSESSVN